MLLLAYCLFNFAFDGNNSISGVFVTRKFNAQPGQLSLLLVLIGVATAVVQAALVERAMKRFGEKRMTVVSLLSQAIGGVLIFVAPALWLVYPISFAQSALSGFIFSSLGTLIAGKVSEREQGTLAGVSAALAGLMSAMGPLFAGLMYDRVLPGASYLTGAAVLLVAIVLIQGVISDKGSKQ